MFTPILSSARVSPPAVKWLCAAVALWFLPFPGGSGRAAEATPAAGVAPVPGTAPDLSALSVEDLANIRVTTATKRPEPLAEVPAAAYVLTREDVRRSGVTTVAEALRLVPGVQVARVDAHTWAISARGFNDTFANKLLVLIDGRSVYTPLFSGVYWDVQNVPLEDIERIEVIRGPGATLWGANAVNGVINIITRSARDTHGGVVSAGGGSEEQGFGSFRYGAPLSENTSIRFFGQYGSRDASERIRPGGAADDRWQLGGLGFRLDWDPRDRNRLTVQGDLHAGRLDQRYFLSSLDPPAFEQNIASPFRVSGGNLLARWTHDFSEDSQLELQSYLDLTRRVTPYLEEQRITGDVALQHHLRLGPRHEIISGLGWRLTSDRLRDSFALTFAERQRSSHLVNVFVQDNFELVPDRLKLSAGTKLEHNDYTGLEVQPGGRLLFTPSEQHKIWTSVSRAVRTPSRAEAGVRLNDDVLAGSPPTVVSIFGNSDYDSEEVVASELGYRVSPHPRFSFDLAGFYNLYDRLRTTEQAGAGVDPTLPGSPNVALVNLRNRAEGATFGLEAAAEWQPASWWRWRAGYSWLRVHIHPKATSTDGGVEADEAKSPRHQFFAHSSWDLPGRVELDLIGRYVSTVPDHQVPAYLTLDARIAWRPVRDLELELVGQNLLDDRHPEFRPTIISTQRTQVPRGVYGRVTVRF